METEGDPETQGDREVQNGQIMPQPNEVIIKGPENDLIAAPEAQVPPKSLEEGCVEDVETVPGRSPLNPAAFRQMFRKFHYEDASGPRDVLRHLLALARQWLRPDINTKEQIVEMLVQEQFLAVLPEELRAHEQKGLPGVRFTG